MSRISAAVGVAMLLAAPAAAGDPPDGAYGWMAELAGACWSATYPDGTRDTQCYSAQYGRFLRGTIEVLPGPASSRPPYRGDSVAFWDPDRGEIAVHYWSDAGNHGVMTGRIEGETIVFPMPARDGGEPSIRTVWTRIGADGFRIVQQRREAERRSDTLSIAYSRTGSFS